MNAHDFTEFNFVETRFIAFSNYVINCNSSIVLRRDKSRLYISVIILISANRWFRGICL